MRYTPEELANQGFELNSNGQWVKKKKQTNNARIKSVKVEVDGIKFDSKREAKRAGQLQMMEKHGIISKLRFQVAFPLATEESIESAKKRGLGKLAIPKYKADFVYMRDGVKVVEDSKGFRTEMYRIKKRFMKLIYDIDILET